MTGEDMKFLANRADTVRGRDIERLAEVHARIGSARRRRVAGAVAGASAAVVALVVGIAAVTGPSGQHGDNGPIPPANSDTPTTSTTRKIVYSDDLTFLVHAGSGALLHVGTIHVGDREVDVDQTLHTVQTWALQVTDAGVVYAKDDQSMWFTDGGSPRRIADRACVGTAQASGFATGNVGPWVVWFDCSPAVLGTDLVVFDTVSGHEVARHSIPSCRVAEPVRFGLGYKCGPVDVVGDHVYVHRNDRDFVFDVTSDRVIPASPRMYDDDLRTHSRALVTGDSWQTGNVTDGEHLTFSVEGSRLVPLADVDSERVPSRLFDAATGQPVRLRLPAGYHPDPKTIAETGSNSFTLIQWLDADTIALSQGINNSVGDLITCHLSDGLCHLAVKAESRKPHVYRIVAGGSLPG